MRLTSDPVPDFIETMVIGRSQQLALGELEAPPRSCVTVLFPFNHAGIAGKEPVAPQAGIVGVIHLAERAGKAMAAGTGLAIAASAIHIDQNIKLVLAGCYHQGLADNLRVFPLGEIKGQFLAVDRDLAASVPDIHPRDRRFPSACPDSKILYHK